DATVGLGLGEENAPAVVRHFDMAEMRPAVLVDRNRGAQINIDLAEIRRPHLVPPIEEAGLPRFERVPYPFWNYSYRKPLRCVNGFWRRLRDEAGLPGVRIHDLRHTFASHAAMNKETLPMIGRLLGHANVQTTARYAHLDDRHLLEAAQQIGDAVGALMDTHRC
ncbi:MAG: tyrosine-type recombinase/integrase, partial [Erythrobacter sp.]|nr:tyrosine-type recombinase/integrase [Erythrobacter sp.]